MKKRLHENSLIAYRDIREDRSTRADAIYTYLLTTGRIMTDRDLMAVLGFREPNATRPRITELIDNRWLVEVDSVECPVTGKRVRRVKALTREQRAPIVAAYKAHWRSYTPGRALQAELFSC